MSRYTYDDFRVTFSRRDGDDYGLRARFGDREWSGTFAASTSELEHELVGLVRGGVRCIAPGVLRDLGTDVRRDVGDLVPARVGGLLAAALFAGEIGRGYEEAARSIDRQDGRGLRLTLSLAECPELLSIPWEFLYRRPTFLAVQPHLPLVRHLELGPSIDPPVIRDAVRILGIVASPHDLAPLDVDAERHRVEQAVAEMRSVGRVELDWLEPATPRRLREALRDARYHALHYVGHSDFVVAPDGSGEGVLFLEHGDDGRAVAVDSTMLANLLGDQDLLQLVVLNSCEGARTTLTDPYAGVATTLVQLGVPAVIGMQFAISDEAAIVFAEELYTNLIGRQDPIDAAVAEARKAIFIEVSEVEWATPVLFLRDPEADLFCFEVDATPLPPPRSLDPPPSITSIATAPFGPPSASARGWPLPRPICPPCAARTVAAGARRGPTTLSA